ncbi:hypothetical protein QQP08_010952 [Theobroma cacao]|nr:hypothetical protein QQP08_010952 [Theobroma cacao]
MQKGRRTKVATRTRLQQKLAQGLTASRTDSSRVSTSIKKSVSSTSLKPSPRRWHISLLIHSASQTFCNLQKEWFSIQSSLIFNIVDDDACRRAMLKGGVKIWTYGEEVMVAVAGYGLMLRCYGWELHVIFLQIKKEERPLKSKTIWLRAFRG